SGERSPRVTRPDGASQTSPTGAPSPTSANPAKGEAMGDRAENADASIVDAAEAIAGELETHGDPMAADLRSLVDEAKAADGDTKAAAVDPSAGLPVSREGTRRRLGDLAPPRDVERGVSAGVWGGDSVLAGKLDATRDTVETPCGTCRYVNKLRYRPPEDDVPQCQNPKPPVHPLALT